MTKQRRTFTPECKHETASLVLDHGCTHIEAARSIESVESASRRWVNHLEQERGVFNLTCKALTPEQQKIKELQSRCLRKAEPQRAAGASC